MPFFEGSRGRLHYRRWPVRQPLAVLEWLPGSGQHTGHYHRFARALGAQHIEVWGLDTAGQGLSEGDPAAPGSIDELAADALRLAALIRRELPDASLIVAGHSLGAATALTARAALPDCAGLVLTGTPTRAATPDALVPEGLPVLALHGVDDRRAPIDPIRDWTGRQQSVGLREYTDAGHDLLHEPVHARVTADIAEWVRGVVASAVRTPVE
ncbi:alpha/beta fold hydrolase [Nocardia sp. CA2R105]|uniref:alpha/beta hydrolase n=1 Tax=Nocardia coffeae TaxID=2873381 RepID=UPI001CA6F1AE|nr:alpha/beta fold hydrolase [Nocardia coffeae]MBY8862559.1 alpha/beta fold hydrolase [Nocardia coffeae]